MSAAGQVLPIDNVTAEGKKCGKSVAGQCCQEKVERKRPAGGPRDGGPRLNHWPPKQNSRYEKAGVLEDMPKTQMECQLEDGRNVPDDHSETARKETKCRMRTNNCESLDKTRSPKLSDDTVAPVPRQCVQQND